MCRTRLNQQEEKQLCFQIMEFGDEYSVAEALKIGNFLLSPASCSSGRIMCDVEILSLKLALLNRMFSLIVVFNSPTDY